MAGDYSMPTDSGGISLDPNYWDIISSRVGGPAKKVNASSGQFTRVSNEHMRASAKCKTARAVALYLKILKFSQLEEFRVTKKGGKRSVGVKIPCKDLEDIGLRGKNTMSRASLELERLGLVRVIRRPGY